MDVELLDEQLVGQYMSIELGTPSIPQNLIKYVSDITLGNPYFIRESIQNLTSGGHMSVARSGDVLQGRGKPASVGRVSKLQ